MADIKTFHGLALEILMMPLELDKKQAQGAVTYAWTLAGLSAAPLKENP